MYNHEQERSILDQQGEVTPWMGEVQLYLETDEPTHTIRPFLQSPYQIEPSFGQEEEMADLFEGEKPWNVEAVAKRNKELSSKLKWENYLRGISILLTGFKQVMGLPSSSPAILLKADDVELAKRLSHWQQSNKTAPNRKTALSVDGELGLNTWTVMQEKLGLLNFRPGGFTYNLESAIAKNKARKKEMDISIWEALKGYGIINASLPLNDEYFSYALANFQKKNPEIQVTGWLDDDTLILLKPERRKNIDFYKKGILENTYTNEELADQFIAHFKIIETRIKDVRGELFNKIQNIKIQEKSYSNWKLALDITVTTIAAIAAAPATGGSSLAAGIAFVTPLVGIGGNKHLEDLESRSKDQAEKAKIEIFKMLVNGANISIANNTTHSLGEILIKEDVAAVIDTFEVKNNLGFVVNLIANMRELIRKDNGTAIDKTFLLNVFSYFAPHPRLIVAYNNTTPVDYWHSQDVENVKEKHAQLRIEFLEQSPGKIGVDKINALQYRDKNIPRLLKAVWDFWTEKGFGVKDFILGAGKNEVLEYINLTQGRKGPMPHKLYVFFKANYAISSSPPIGISIEDDSKSPPWGIKAPFETLVNIIKQGDDWIPVLEKSIFKFKVVDTPSDYITGPVTNLEDKLVYFNQGGHRVIRKIGEKNQFGVLFSEIIIKIVNHVMKRDYKEGGKIIFWEGETHSHSPYEIDTEQEHDNFEPLEGEVVMPHPNRSRFRPLSQTFMSPQVLQSNSTANQRLLAKAQLGIGTISGRLDVCVRMEEIEHFMKEHNRQYPDNAYVLSSADQSSTGAVFTEAIHQFQIINYFDTKEHTGLLDASLLDTLRFAEHGLRPRLSSSGFFGQKRLNEISGAIAAATNHEFSAANWFKYIMRPSFLGHKIKDGVHLLLLLKLGHAETWLLSQPQYKGMTPVQLGRALGLGQPDVVYSGARLSNENQAMHGFGLAIDIDKAGNPWIGAGWIQNDKEKLKERTQMLQTLRKASTETLKGGNIFQYLDSIARDVGNDTRQAYQVLQQRNQEFIAYLKNQDNQKELQYWKNSATFTNRDPLKGFLSLHPDLVYALREVAGLAWGAIDFGPRASGDIMHFDLRTQGAGKVICKHLPRAHIIKYGHPILSGASAEKEWEYEDYEDVDTDDMADPEMEWEHHEAIEEAEWEEEEDEENHDHEF